jgi:hypothetical protein
VVLVDIDAGGMEKTVRDLAGRGMKAKAITTDVTSRQAVEDMAAAAHGSL